MTKLFSHLIDLVEQLHHNKHCLQSQLEAQVCFLPQSSNGLLIEFNKSAQTKDSHFSPTKLQQVLHNMTFGICATIAFKLTS